MPRGRPRKQPTEEIMPEEVKETEVVEAPKQGSTHDNKCPWCVSKKAKNKVELHRTTYQCGTCGKDWKESDLGKPWSIELERGESWAREMQARAIRG